MWLAVTYLPECDLEQIQTKYCLCHCFSSYKPSLKERYIYFYQLINFMWNRTSQLKMPCAERALQNRSSVKTYCALTYKQMEWAGVFDNNFYTVFCLKFWKSCPAMLHRLVPFFNVKKSVWQNWNVMKRSSSCMFKCTSSLSGFC